MGKQAKMAPKMAKKMVFVLVSLVALAGCQKVPSNGAATGQLDGKVVSVGNTHLILDDGTSVMFVTIEESDKERLKDLRSGDKVTLVSKTDEADENTVDIVEIITADGTHIPLGV